MKYYLGISKVQAAVTGKLSLTARSHLKPKARGSSWEEQPEERWLRRHRRA